MSEALEPRPVAESRSELIRWAGGQETDDEQRRRREAEVRRANRLAERNQILQERG